MKNKIKKIISTTLVTSLIAMIVLPAMSFATTTDYSWSYLQDNAENIDITVSTGTPFMGETGNVIDGRGGYTDDTGVDDYLLVNDATPWVVFDLKGSVSISDAKLNYNWRDAVGYIKLYGSADGDEWTYIDTFGESVDHTQHEDYGSKSSGQIPALIENISMQPSEYRYVKLQASGTGIFKIFEFSLNAFKTVYLQLESTTPQNNADYQEKEITLDFDYSINLESAKTNIEVYKGETKLTIDAEDGYTVALDESDATKVYVTLKEAPVYDIAYKVVVLNTLNTGLDGYATFAAGTQNFVINFKNNQNPALKAYKWNFLQDNAENIDITVSTGTPSGGNLDYLVNGNGDYETDVGVGDYLLVNDVTSAPWVKIDFKDAVSIAGAKLNYNWRDQIGYIRLFGSADGNDWTDIGTFGETVNHAQHPNYNSEGKIPALTENIDMEPVKYRYIKLEATYAGVFKLYELNILGTAPLKLTGANVVDDGLFSDNVITLKFNSKINLDSAKSSISMKKGGVEYNAYSVALADEDKTVKITMDKAPRVGESYTLTISKDINRVDGFIPFDETVQTEDITYNFSNKQIEHNQNYLADNEIVGESDYILADNGKIETITNGEWYESALNAGNYGIIKNDAAPPEIIFDLKEEISVGGAKLNYNWRDQIGYVKIYASSDKEAWTYLDTFGEGVDHTQHPDYGMEVANQILCLTEEVELSLQNWRYIKLQATNSGILKIFEFAVYESAIADFVTPTLVDTSDIFDSDVDISYEAAPVYNFDFCCRISADEITKDNISLVYVKNGEEIAVNGFTVTPNSETDCDGFTMTVSEPLYEGTKYIIKMKNIKAVTDNPENAKTMKDTTISFTTAKNYELLTPTVSADATSVSVNGNMRTYHNVKNEDGVIIAALLEDGKFVEVKKVAFTAADIANGFDESSYSFAFTHTRIADVTYSVKIYAVDGYASIGKICEKQSIDLPNV